MTENTKSASFEIGDQVSFYSSPYRTRLTGVITRFSKENGWPWVEGNLPPDASWRNGATVYGATVNPVDLDPPEVPVEELAEALGHTLPGNSPRANLLDEAKQLVTGDRNNAYGPPTADFEVVAEMLNAMGYRGPDGRLLKPYDTAVIMVTLKLSRIRWSPGKRDNWTDTAGYAACGWECVEAEG